MDIASRKLELIEKLMEVINPKKIEKIERFFKKEISEEIDSSNIQFPEVVHQLLKKSEEDFLNGNVITHENVMKEARERYKLS